MIKTLNKKRITAFLLALLLVIEVMFSLSPFRVSAEGETQYSNVLDDLSVDSTFDKAKYPLMSYDNFKSVNEDADSSNNVDFIQVIQISESKNGELFVYTYQPLNNVSDITASSINFATTESSILDLAKEKKEATKFKKYSLECVSSEGSFKKYLVKNFTVSNSYYRYYCISEIERPFDTLLDEKIGNETITDFKAHSVAQAWCCYYLNNELVYEMQKLDVVLITPTHTGELYYEHGVTWESIVGVDKECVSHYIAFNVENYKIDDLIDADLVYQYRDYRYTEVVESGFAPLISYIFSGKSSSSTYYYYPNGSEFTPADPLYLHKSDTVTFKGDGLFSKEYTWSRIMTGKDFVKKFEDQGGEYGETEKSIVKNSQYVFAFCETTISSAQYSVPSDSIFGTSTYTTVIDGTEIAKVDILRLKFMSNGVEYNLGVVGDTTTSDGKPDGNAGGLDFGLDLSFLKDFLKIISLILVAILLVSVIDPLINIFKLVFSAIVSFVELFVKILTFPFRSSKK